MGQEGQYLGPLPRQCQCGRFHQQLIAKDARGKFRTSEAAAYPPAMDEFIALAVWAVLSALASSPLKRPEGEKKQEKGIATEKEEDLERDKVENENEEINIHVLMILIFMDLKQIKLNEVGRSVLGRSGQLRGLHDPRGEIEDDSQDFSWQI